MSSPFSKLKNIPVLSVFHNQRVNEKKKNLHGHIKPTDNWVKTISK